MSVYIYNKINKYKSLSAAIYWHCPTQSRVYKVVEHPSARLPHRSTAAVASSSLLLSTLSEGDIDRQSWVPAPHTSCRCTMQQVPALSSNSTMQ